MRRIRRWVAGAGAVVLLALSCSQIAVAAERNSASGNDAAYASAGPYKVGYTTLPMGDRSVDVWYPAKKSATKGKPEATYDQRTPLPENLHSFVPDEYNTVVTMEAYADVKGSKKGPFRVVLFSHGVGAYRMASSALLAGIASWGFVVVSADYLERGVVTQLPGQTTFTLDAERDKQLMLAGLDLVVAESDRSGSVLKGLVNDSNVAALGHSAGATAAFDSLSDSRVQVAVGWAPAAPSGTPAEKPTMIIGAANDFGVTPAVLDETYGSLPPPKRRVEIGNSGHNSFTDLCLVTASGGGMIQFGVDSGFIPESVAAQLLNGCEADALTPEEFFPVVQHFTVAELRSALGIDEKPVGLGSGATRAFPGITVTYEQER